MNRPADVDRTLESWLAEGPSQLPDHVIDGIVRQLDATHQRKHWWLPRKGTMTRSAFSVGGVAAAFLIAVVGFVYFSGRPGPNVGGAPTPSPTPSPVALPTDGAVVERARYEVTVDGYRYTFRVPSAGWKATVVTLAEAESEWTIRPNRADVELTQGGASNDPPDLAGFGLWGNVTAFHPSPCSVDFGFSTDFGSTADELATAIASLRGFRSSEPTDVTVGRYSGKRFQLTVRADMFADCPSGTYKSFTDEHEKNRMYQGPEQVDDIWILDLDNGARQLFLSTYFPTTPAELVDELRQIVESVEISPAEGTQGAAPTEESRLIAHSNGRAAAFDGIWESTDADGSHQTMAMSALPHGTYGVTIRDDRAAVCSGAPSTLTGVAETNGPGTIAIGQPEYTCDDDSQPRALSGPPLEEQLQDLSFTYDFQRDALNDSLGLAWSRVVAAP